MQTDEAESLTEVLRDVGAQVRKDLRLEVRQLHEVTAVIAFGVISILLFSFSIGTSARPEQFAPGVVWVILFFASVLLFHTTFTREREQGTLGGLRSLPVASSVVYVCKIVSGAVLLFAVEAIIVPASMAFLGYAFTAGVLQVLYVFLLGNLGLAVSAAFVSALTMYTESRTILYPVLMFPLTFPVLAPSISLTRNLMVGPSAVGVEANIIMLTAASVFIVSVAHFDQIFSD